MTMTENDQRHGLRIGELAALVGLNPKTIRYYEQIGLLPTPQRLPSGYRAYSEADADRLRFIGKAKAVGLMLEEIAGILAVRDQGGEPCDQVRQVIDQKIAAVDEHIRTLQEFRADLLALQAEATTPVMGTGTICAIIEGHCPAHQATRSRAMPQANQGRKRLPRRD